MNVKNETPAGELSDEQILEIFSAPPHLHKTLTTAARAVIVADRALRIVSAVPAPVRASMPIIWVGALDDALVRQADAQAALAAKDAEIARLTHCLAGANAQAEEFERKWYLRGHDVENLTTERDKWVAQVQAMQQLADTAKKRIERGAALARLAEAKPGAQAVPVLLTDAKISEIVGNNDDTWGHLDGVGIAREVEAAVHAANPAPGSEAVQREPATFKPCPFCGGLATPLAAFVACAIECINCEASTGPHDSIEEAAMAWNKRNHNNFKAEQAKQETP